MQVELGPRPAGSRRSRQLAARLRTLLPDGPLPGRARRAAQRDRQRARAADAASWCSGRTTTLRTCPASWAPTTAPSGMAVAGPARPHHQAARLRRTVVFAALRRRGEPARHARLRRVRARGLRGQQLAARRLRDARAMMLLDFVGDRRLRIPREGFRTPRSGASCVTRPPGGCGGSVPRRNAGSDPRRPCPVPAAGRARRSTSSTSTSPASTAAATTCPQSPSAVSTPPGRPCCELLPSL